MENLLKQMVCAYCGQVSQHLIHPQQERFGTLSSSITERIDDMGSKIDDLEKQIAELVQATSSTQQSEQ